MSVPHRLVPWLSLTVAVRSVVLTCALWVFVLPAAQAGEADGLEIGQVRLGIGGALKVGCWTSISAQVRSKHPLRARLVVEAVDPEGSPTRFPSPEVALPGNSSPATLTAVFQTGRLGGRIKLQVVSDGQVLATRRFQPSSADEGAEDTFQPALKQSALLVATLGQPAGFQYAVSDRRGSEDDLRTAASAVHLSELDDPAELPQLAAGYESLDALVVAGDYSLAAQDEPDGDEAGRRRSRAIRRWVERGGHLLISISDVDRYRQSPLAEWVPVPVVGTTQLRELSDLESYAGKTTRIKMPGLAGVPAAQLGETDGTVDVGSRDGPLLVRTAHGFGQVTFLALDLTRAPLAQWPALTTVTWKMLSQAFDAQSAEHQAESGRLAHSGITDLATQLHAAADYFPSVDRHSFLGIIGLLFVYMLVVGPLDYVLVHRLLRRPQWTWVTLPTFLVVALVLTVRGAVSSNGRQLQLNQVSLLDVDGTAQSVDVRQWLTIYSPQTRRYQVNVRPQALSKQEAGSPPHQAVRVCWSGIPESVYGGMYRQGAIEFSRPQYSLQVGGAGISNIPIPIWSSRTVRAEWRFPASPNRGIVESQLTSPKEGQLAGSFTHHLPGPVHDWVVAYGNRAFYPADTDRKIVLRPGRPWTPTTPGVRQRRLDGFLTGTVQRRLVGQDGGNKETILIEKRRHDRLDRNLTSILQMVTFHRAAGGKSHTGLDNSALRKADLSRLLDLNRAVLFGRVEIAPWQCRLNDEPAEPTRQASFVRIVLPVQKQTR